MKIVFWVEKVGWDEKLQDFDLNQLMRPRKVCVCRQVSEEEIRACIRNGATTLEEISARTEAATNCGTCAGAVQSILRDELTKMKFFPTGENNL